MKFVLFVGNNRVGKTTMSKALVELLTHSRKDAIIVPFAEAVRDELVEIYGLPTELVHDAHINKNECLLCLGDYKHAPGIPNIWVLHGFIDKLEDYHTRRFSLRDIFIIHATDFRRKQDPNYWVKKFHTNLTKFPNLEYCVIDDCRFFTEIDSLHDPLIFKLNNGCDHELDKVEQICAAMCAANVDRMTQLTVPIPLLQLEASRMCKKLITEYLKIPLL